jgi:hypothetical protein
MKCTEKEYKGKEGMRQRHKMVEERKKRRDD